MEVRFQKNDFDTRFGRDSLGPIQAATQTPALVFHKLPEILDRVYFSQSSKEFLLIRRWLALRISIEISLEL